jgi:DNA-binding XRE family transcriptional regulator
VGVLNTHSREQEAMTSSQRESFGPLVRREREAQEIALRQMAKMIGVSPTYLSKIERGAFPPPSEDKVPTSCWHLPAAWHRTLPKSFGGRRARVCTAEP